MKTLSGIMSEQSKREYLESSRARYPSRNRAGKSRMIDEVSDVFGWDRKHTIKALNSQVSLGSHAKKRGSKPTYGPAESEVIVAIWRLSEQPCGLRLKATLPAGWTATRSTQVSSPSRSATASPATVPAHWNASPSLTAQVAKAADWGEKPGAPATVSKPSSQSNAARRKWTDPAGWRPTQ